MRKNSLLQIFCQVEFKRSADAPGPQEHDAGAEQQQPLQVETIEELSSSPIPPGELYACQLELQTRLEAKARTEEEWNNTTEP